MGGKNPKFYLGTDIDGVYLNAEQLYVRSENLNDLLGRISYTDALFHILLGRLPSDEGRKLFDLVLVAFHGGFGLLPPTTLVPRLVAGTGVSTPQALAAGYLASGVYHVGAVEQAMVLYSKIANAFRDEPAESCKTAGALETFAYDWISRMIERHETVPGYGHPLLRRDPRPTHVRRVVADWRVESVFLDVYDGVVRCMSEKKGVSPNVDGVTGSILLTLGFQPQHGTGLFLLARTAAMLAHIIEEQTDMPYQTQKRFMILPVAMPRLFNANFKRLAKFFNNMRDNKAYQALQTVFSRNAKKAFVERERTDQSVIEEVKRDRMEKSIDEALQTMSVADNDALDQFVSGAQLGAKLPVDANNDAQEDTSDFDVGTLPELLASAALLLTASTGSSQINSQPDARAKGSAGQASAAQLLNAALNLVQESSKVDSHPAD